MLTREQFDALVLDYLYDLLEPADRQAVEDFMAAHTEARLEADRVKGLFAVASKTEFPDVRFTPPPATPVAPSAPRPERQPASMSRIWLRWVVSAVVLLAVGSAVAPAIRHGLNYSHYHRIVRERERIMETEAAQLAALVAKRNKAFAEASEKLADTDAKLAALRQDFGSQLDRAMKTSADKQIQMVITGPESVTPGAVNEYVISTNNRNGNPTPARLAVRVRDQDNRVVLEVPEVRSQGRHAIALPPDLPLKPNSQLVLEVTAHDEGGPQNELVERLQLASPRYLTHLATDKPMYQPGDTVFFRSLTLNRSTLRPADEDFHVNFVLTGPQGEQLAAVDGATRVRLLTDSAARTLLGWDNRPIRGVGAGEFQLSDDVTGGEYTLTVSEMNNRFPPEKRKFIVNKYTPDRLNKDLDFTRKSYGAGDEVVANVKVSFAEGGPAAGATIQVSANVDGKIVTGKPATTDAAGNAKIAVTLPTAIDAGVASLSLRITQQGIVDAMVKPIPLVLTKLNVEFFPEGGELLAGAQCRVYFRARTMLDKPAELKGRIVDKRGKEVSRVETVHDDTEAGVNQGLGVFALTPMAGETYKLVIDEPKGVTSSPELPPAKAETVSMMVPAAIAGGADPIQVKVRVMGKARSLLVGAYSRGRLLDHQRVAVEPGVPAVVSLKPEGSAGGVVRLTVFEEVKSADPRHALKPVAERLVFRKPAQKLSYTIQPNKTRYSPGEQVVLTVSATDETGKPAQGVALLSVVNQTVVTMADEKTFRSMPTHFLLAGEVRQSEDLEYADFLVGDHPKAATALDLLLGTQGWRRFAEQPVEYRSPKNADADRMLLAVGQAARRAVDLRAVEQRRLTEAFKPRFAELSDRRRDAVEAFQAFSADKDFPQEHAARVAALNNARTIYQQARQEFAPFERERRELLQWIAPAVAGLCCVGALALVVVAMRREVRRAVPHYFGATASIVAAVALIVVAMQGDGSRKASVVADATAAWGDQPAIQDAPMANEMGEMGGAMDQAAGMGPPQRAMPMAPGGMGGPPGMFAPKAPAGPRPDDPAVRFAMPKGAKPDGAKFDGLRQGGDNVDKDFFHRADGKWKKGDGQVDNLERLKVAAGGLAEPQAAKKRLGELKEGQAQREMVAGVRARNRGNMARDARELPFGQNRLEAIGPGGMPGGGVPAPGLPGGGPAFGGGGFGGGRGGRGMGLPAGAPMDAKAFEREQLTRSLLTQAEPFLVREYAHFIPAAVSNNSVRQDFTETIYWNPVLLFGEGGKATVTFQLADSITRYQVMVAGNTNDGRLGSAVTQIEARKPFSVEAKLPVEMTSSDRLDLPILITNDTDNQRAVRLNIDPQNLVVPAASRQLELMLNPSQRSRRVVRLQPSASQGLGRLSVAGKSEPFAPDSFVRTVPIVSEGFPIAGQHSDLAEGRGRCTIQLPADYVGGSLRLSAHVFPSTLADLQKGLEGLLREPGGCFEQTSTSNYPNTLILQYLQESDQAAPEAAKRAKELLDRGYKMLTAFECIKSGNEGREGYEWFGGNAPPHEALTAYGLLEFHDMARVHNVDPAMVARTRHYLLSRMKADGTFERNARALDTFGRAPAEITDAYIVWAITETGAEDVSAALKRLQDAAKTNKDPYFLALLANALLNREQSAAAVEFLKSVMERQGAEGGVAGAATSITCSGGRDLEIETTALAVLGWLKAKRPDVFTQAVNNAAKWIGRQRGGYGGFGSTQSTILALKALIGHAKANKRTPEGGEIILTVGGKSFRKAFSAGTAEAVDLVIEKPEELLKPGTNDVEVQVTTRQPLPFTVAWSYNCLTPSSADKCAVRLSTILDKTKAKEGESLRLTAVLENTAKDKGQPMTVAIIGLPAGLKVPEDMKQLKDHAKLRNNATEAGLIAAFEIRGRDLVLYWRDLKPGAKVEVPIDLICEYPGEFRGAASRAYLYYNADHKHWVPPLAIAIEAQPEE